MSSEARPDEYTLTLALADTTPETRLGVLTALMRVGPALAGTGRAVVELNGTDVSELALRAQEADVAGLEEVVLLLAEVPEAAEDSFGGKVIG